MKRVYSIFIELVSITLLMASIHFSEIAVDNETKQEAVIQESTNFFKDKILLKYNGITIQPWEQNGNIYFFLPSYFDLAKATLEVPKGQLQVDGKTVNASNPFISYELEKDYKFLFTWRHKESTGRLQFLQSANIGTIFIKTNSNSMETVHRDKENKESGKILIIDANGIPFYDGFLSYIKGRGNVTWKSQKKSYAIKLSEATDLFSMGEGRNWVLISNVFDGNKLQNKLCLEMATALGLEYTPESIWVDLYLNGEYWGNYLLCEKIEAGENRVAIEDLEEETEFLNGSLKRLKTFNTGIQKGVLAEQNPNNITGGYIFEGDTYYNGDSGFITTSGNPFTLTSPQYATQEQITYLADYVQQIENLIYSGSDEVFDYIDLDSFVARYLLEEFVWNYDFGIHSMYFYKYQDDPLVYAGPAWDYDCSLGRYSLMHSDILIVHDLQDYNASGRPMWYPFLYENETFYLNMIKTYKEVVQPYVQTLFEQGGVIDRYAEMIKSSIAMDMIRWNYSETWTGHYIKFENNIRYLKYFLAKRLSSLDLIWLGKDNTYTFEKGTGKYHLVTFSSEKGSKSYWILDGECIQERPNYLLNEGEWWHNPRNWANLGSEVPVYEDFIFCSGGM